MASKREILHHVGYEWWMFSAAYALLDEMDTASDPIRNALLESMIVHGRGLIYFFCHKKRFSTDWNGDDLGLGLATEEPVLKEWRDEANGRIAHLTELREKPQTAWKASAVKTELAKLVNDLAAKCKADLPNPWIGNEAVTSKHWTAPPGAARGGGGQPTPPAPPPPAATPPPASASLPVKGPGHP